jgi:hypothetical protein
MQSSFVPNRLVFVFRAARLLACATLLLAVSARAADPAAARLPMIPRADPAIAGVLNAFQQKPVVCIGDVHGVAQQGEFYINLVSDPRFAETVQNIVMEVGAGQHQATIDTYVKGGAVSYEALRRVWADTVSWQVGFTSTMYPSLFAAVRKANQSLPDAKKIKVWLADPPANWSEITEITQLFPLFDRRNVHAANLIREKILAVHGKALVIFGSTHLYPVSPHPMFPDGSIVSNLEATHPGSTFKIVLHVGSFTPQGTQRLEALLHAGKVGAGTLLQPVAGTWIQRILADRHYSFLPPSPSGEPVPPEFEKVFSGEWADAYLYLGDRADLIESPVEVSGFMDPAYFDELDRRHKIRDGGPLRLEELLDATVARPLFEPMR